jgi:hypothetical protein
MVNKSKPISLLTVLSLSGCGGANWLVQPGVTVSEIFSDNLKLSPTRPESGFVSEVSPSVRVSGETARSRVNANYRLQGLYNAGGREAVSVNHQLLATGLLQAIPNTLFVNASSAISQQNSSNALVATDNIAGNFARLNSQSVAISPYWTPHFGRYANGLLKLGYSHVSVDQLAGSPSPLLNPLLNTRVMSDANTVSKQAQLSNGRYFNHWQWSVDYSAEQQQRQSGQDVRFERYASNNRYALNRHWSLLAQGGYENNAFTSLNSRIRNGFYYQVGAQWQPNYWLSLEALGGNNQQLGLRLTPSAFFSADLIYRYKSVGLNSGSSWEGTLRYQPGQSLWQLRYSEDTTTLQKLLQNQAETLDPNRPQASQPDPLGYAIRLPNVVDDVLVRQRGELSWQYTSGKSQYQATVYNERRSYSASAGHDQVNGISGRWQLQLAPRWSLYAQPLWQVADGIASQQRRDIAVGVIHGLPISLLRPAPISAKLEFRHSSQQADRADFRFEENRLTASVFIPF